jgi:hypothetical protein
MRNRVISAMASRARENNPYPRMEISIDQSIAAPSERARGAPLNS